MDLINTIIENKIKCVFVSPHFDDAAFSMGGLISAISQKTETCVVTVFTGAGDGRNSLSAKRFLKTCGSENARALYDLRKREDERAFSSIGAKVYSLGYAEALWRNKKVGGFRRLLAKYLPEFDRVYPIYRLNITSGKIAIDDQKIIREISQKIKKIAQGSSQTYVFCPVGFGNHVDHILVREACKSVGFKNIFYWSDFPYEQKPENNDFIKANNLTRYYFDQTFEGKIKLCEQYGSQINSAIPDKRILYKPEVLYKRGTAASYSVKAFREISQDLRNEWKNLWNASSSKNYFNSPLWFENCQKAFGYKQTLILACYKNGILSGILPIVEGKIFGQKVYLTPGEQYYDASSVLTAENEPEVISALASELKNFGNFYLRETHEHLAKIVASADKHIAVKKSSICPYLPLRDDPYRFLSSRNKRRMLKVIEDEKDNFKITLHRGSLAEYLDIMVDIESKSPKVADHKDIFQDSKLIDLYKYLSSADPGNFLTCLLYYKGEPICYRYGYTYTKTYLVCNTAYKENYEHLMPGKIIAYLILAELKNLGIDTIDFSRGDSRFKKEFTPYYYDQYTLFYFKNPVIFGLYRVSQNIMIFLVSHPRLFEILRKNKRMILNFLEVITNKNSRKTPKFSITN